MTRLRFLLWLTLAPALVGFDPLRITNRAVEDGNAKMKAGKPDEALPLYEKALGDHPAEAGAHFDRGAALFALGRFDDAAQAFLRATEAKSPALKASAFYNLGNSFFQGKKYGEAAEAYKRSLALDPNDMRAKWNLELALRMKKADDEKKQKDKDKNKQNKDDKDDKKDKDDHSKDKDPSKKDDQKDDKKDDQKKANDPKDKNQDQDKNQDPAQNQKKDKPESDKPAGQDQDSKSGPPPEAEKAPDQQEIESILDNLERSPKSLEQERARLRAVRRRPPVKDW